MQEAQLIPKLSPNDDEMRPILVLSMHIIGLNKWKRSERRDHSVIHLRAAQSLLLTRLEPIFTEPGTVALHSGPAKFASGFVEALLSELEHITQQWKCPKERFHARLIG